MTHGLFAAQSPISGGLSSAQVAALIAGGTLPASFTTGAFSSDITLSGAPTKIKPAADSTSAIQLANAAGTAFFNVNTSNGRINIGATDNAAARLTLEVPDNALSLLIRYSAVQTGVASAGQFELRNMNTTVNNYSALSFRNGNNGYMGGIEFINVNHNATGSATSEIRLVLNNAGSLAERVRFKSNGAVEINPLDAVTDSILTALTLKRNVLSTGVGAAGLGVSILYALESSTTVDQSAAVEEVSWDVATHASRAGAKEDSVYLQATKQPYFKAIANSTGGVKTAVNGATPVVRAAHIADPSGGTTQDAEARTAINSILVALENFGILLTS